MNNVVAKTVSGTFVCHLLWQHTQAPDTKQPAIPRITLKMSGYIVRAPVDIVFESPNNEPPEDYDTFVKNMWERSVAALSEVRSILQRSAERNKQYYDLGLKPKTFKVDQWVMYFNP